LDLAAEAAAAGAMAMAAKAIRPAWLALWPLEYPYRFDGQVDRVSEASTRQPRTVVQEQ
jgi:hypothetical protein